MSESRPDVILISLDSVRVDAFRSGDYPLLRALSDSGTLFTHVTCSAPFTPVSHASVFTGRQPFHHGIRHLFREQLAADIPTLAEAFRAEGYVTGAFVASAGLHRWYGMDKGFDIYEDDLPLLPDGTNPLEVVDVANRGSAYVKGEIVIERATGWLKSVRMGRQPVFAFIHLFDAHWPYNPPQPWATRYSGHLYEGEIAYMDDCLKELGPHVDPAHSLFVLFSDHGEDLGEHGGKGSSHPEEMGHGALLFENTLRVFMLFSGLDMPQREIARQARLIDLAPTLLDILGFGNLPGADGESLKPAIYGQSAEGVSLAYSETFFPEELAQELGTYQPLRSVKIEAGDHLYKVVWEVGGDGAVAVYDLKSDPFERRNLLSHYGNSMVADGLNKALRRGSGGY